MKPGTRELLGRLLDVAMRSQADPMRRVDADEAGPLLAEVKQAADAPHVGGPRIFNDFTVALAAMLLKVAVQGPWGDAREVSRARKVIDLTVPMVREDLATALEMEARHINSDQFETRRGVWPAR